MENFIEISVYPEGIFEIPLRGQEKSPYEKALYIF